MDILLVSCRHILRFVDDPVFFIQLALDSLRPVIVAVGGKPQHSEVPRKVAARLGALEPILALL